MERRFGPTYEGWPLSIPILTRDVAYADSTPDAMEGITVQFYLPADQSITSAPSSMKAVGRKLSTNDPHEIRPEHRLRLRGWIGHLAFIDPVGPESNRDSILLTYFVDAGALRFPQSGRRLGNCAE
jgi:hypothetical protein